MAVRPHLYAESSVRHIVPFDDGDSIARETAACRNYQHVDSRRFPQTHFSFSDATSVAEMLFSGMCLHWIMTLLRVVPLSGST